jgi:NADH dehydrogenase (ubiquinone) 1 alpha subcomplex subunit 9|uniref:NAD(P)-binding domain-containing protein n=1 Tax=Panagrolaimus sp. PS1159 TaxID=55785 RepID=A0AC35FFB2_9BILA
MLSSFGRTSINSTTKLSATTRIVSYSTDLTQKDGPKYHDIENVPQPRITSQLSQLRKGTGGRASFSGNVVTVFGSTGFLGLPVVNRLAKNGSQLILPYRCDPYYIREHKTVGELGQILFFPFELKDDDSIRKALKYSNVVVNLIGTNMPTKNYNFYETHEHGARRIARIAREMGVERFIQVSALNATPDPKGVMIKEGSNFLRSKAHGEEAVREEFPNATIIRPSVMYGMNDQFIFIYCSRYRKTPLDLVWLYKAGEQTYKMPVHVNDVALGIAKAVYDPTTDGKTYELVGPHCYKLGELIDFMYRRARCTPQFNYHFRRHGLWDPYFRMLAMGTQAWGKFFKCKVPLNWEWIEYVECTNDVLSNLPGFADLGVNRLGEFEYIGGQWADKCTFYGYFDEELGDCPTVPLPLRSPPIIKGRPDPRIADSKRGFGFDVLN